MKNRILFIMLAAFLSLIVLGCGASTNTDTISTESESDVNSEEVSGDMDDVDDSTLTIALGTDMLTFDVHDHRNISTGSIHVNIFNKLLKNENGEYLPDLATDWELIDDETWKFKLREDVKFHNGDKLTAEDVKFTFERVARDETLKDNRDYKQIKEVEVIDDHTFKIHTDGPDPMLLSRVSRYSAGVLPKNYIDQNGMDYFLNEPIGTGPFKYVDWIKDDRVILEVFEDYYDGKNEDWEKIVYRSIPETSTRVAELLTGTVDIISDVAPADWDRVNESKGNSVIEGPTTRTMRLVVQHNDEFPTSDIRVRQAIDLAIDNQIILDHVLGGKSTPTRTTINPSNFGLNEEFYNTYEYDVEKAKELLEEAGYSDGLELTIHSPNGRYLQDRETVEVLSGMLSEIGIKVNLQFMEWGAFAEMRDANKQEDIYYIGLTSGQLEAGTPLNHYHTSVAGEHIGFSHEEIDKLLDTSVTNMNADERERNYKKAQEIVAEELPHIPLFTLDTFYGVSDKLNFEPRIDEMYVAEEITKK